jgi:hypothetical protein
LENNLAKSVECPNLGTLVNALMYELNSKVAGVKESSVSFMILYPFLKNVSLINVSDCCCCCGTI